MMRDRAIVLATNSLGLMTCGNGAQCSVNKCKSMPAPQHRPAAAGAASAGLAHVQRARADQALVQARALLGDALALPHLAARRGR